MIDSRLARVLHERLTAVAQLWQDHLEAPLPEQARGVEIADGDLVLLDASIAGCVSTWFQSGGTLDEGRRTVPADCRDDLSRAIGDLSGDEAAHSRRLQQMAVMVLVAGRLRARYRASRLTKLPGEPLDGPRSDARIWAPRACGR